MAHATVAGLFGASVRVLGGRVPRTAAPFAALGGACSRHAASTHSRRRRVRPRSPPLPRPVFLRVVSCVRVPACGFPDAEDVEMGNECGTYGRADSPTSVSWPPAVGRARGRRRVSARRAALEAKSAAQRAAEDTTAPPAAPVARRTARRRRRAGSDTSDASSLSSSTTAPDCVGAGASGANGAVCACCKLARGELAIHYRVNSCIGASGVSAPWVFRGGLPGRPDMVGCSPALLRHSLQVVLLPCHTGTLWWWRLPMRGC